MKRLTCEVCGCNDLIKQEDVFVCQACGCKFSLDAVRKMMIEGPVEVTGNVQVDNTSTIENYLTLAETALDSEDYDQAYDYAKRILEIDSRCAKAWLIEFNTCIRVKGRSYTDWIAIGKNAIKFSSEPEKQSTEELVYTNFIRNAGGLTDKAINGIDKAKVNMMQQQSKCKSLAREKVSSDMIEANSALLRSETNLLCKIMDLANVHFSVEQDSFRLMDCIPEDALKKRPAFREKIKDWLNKRYDLISKYKDTYTFFENSMKLLYRPYSSYEIGGAVSAFEEQQLKITNRLQEVEKTIEEERRLKIESYWKEHEEEKEALEEEKASLERKIKDLKSSIENSQEYKDLKRLETRKHNTATELESLSVLKFKAKKELKAELDVLNRQVEKAQKAFRDASAPSEQEIERMNTRIQEIEKRLNLES